MGVLLEYLIVIAVLLGIFFAYTLLPAATAVVGALRLAEKRKARGAGSPMKTSRLRVFIPVLAILDGVLIVFTEFLLISFIFSWYYRVLLIIAGILLETVGVMWLLQVFNRPRAVICIVLAGLLTFSLAGGIVYDGVMESRELNEYFDYRTYLPFREDSPVAKLDGDASLEFTMSDDLPFMDGATALYPIYAAFAEAVYPDALGDGEDSEILKYVDCSTTGIAYTKIVDGDCDIIFVAGPSKEQESYAAKNGVTLEYVPIGREAFVFFVHPDNPVDSLTLDQIRDIYSGNTVSWTELGGPRWLGRIQAFQREEGSGSQTAMKRFVMKDTPLMTPETEKTLGGMGDMVERVSSYKNNRGAIGYSFRFYTTELMSNFKVKLLAINGVEPTVENIENGTYPLASEFYAVVRSDADENTRALLEWIQGPQGQELIRKAGYTPVKGD